MDGHGIGCHQGVVAAVVVGVGGALQARICFSYLSSGRWRIMPVSGWLGFGGTPGWLRPSRALGTCIHSVCQSVDVCIYQWRFVVCDATPELMRQIKGHQWAL